MRGIAKAGRVILGGDLAFSFIQREADDNRAASSPRTVRSPLLQPCGRWPGRCRTAQQPQPRPALPPLWSKVKAVDDPIPAVRRGDDRSRTTAYGSCLRPSDGAFGAAADPLLLTRLGLKIGDRINSRQCCNSSSAPRSLGEPDKLAAGISLGSAPLDQ